MCVDLVHLMALVLLGRIIAAHGLLLFGGIIGIHLLRDLISRFIHVLLLRILLFHGIILRFVQHIIIGIIWLLLIILGILLMLLIL